MNSTKVSRLFSQQFLSFDLLNKRKNKSINAIFIRHFNAKNGEYQ